MKNGFSKKGLWKSSTSFSQDKPIFLVFGENFTFAIRNKYVANELLNENCAKKRWASGKTSQKLKKCPLLLSMAMVFRDKFEFEISIMIHKVLYYDSCDAKRSDKFL